MTSIIINTNHGIKKQSSNHRRALINVSGVRRLVIPPFQIIDCFQYFRCIVLLPVTNDSLISQSEKFKIDKSYLRNPPIASHAQRPLTV